MKKNVFTSVALFVFLLLFAVALFVYRPVNSKFSRITVIGDAKTKVAPDTALLSFSVVTQAAEAVTAQQENAKKSEAVKKAVEAVTQNVKTEFKTDDYNLSPEQDYSGKLPKIAGYEVRNSVVVSVADLTKTGAIIDAATKAEANSVDGIRFILSETSPAQGDALAAATAQALVKAEAIAKSLNGRIVRVVESREGGAPILPSSSGDESKMMSNAASTVGNRLSYRTPVEGGSLDFRSQVVLVVEIDVS